MRTVLRIRIAIGVLPLRGKEAKKQQLEFAIPISLMVYAKVYGIYDDAQTDKSLKGRETVSMAK